jgi:hypothetical protein
MSGAQPTSGRKENSSDEGNKKRSTTVTPHSDLHKSDSVHFVVEKESIHNVPNRSLYKRPSRIERNGEKLGFRKSLRMENVKTENMKDSDFDFDSEPKISPIHLTTVWGNVEPKFASMNKSLTTKAVKRPSRIGTPLLILKAAGKIESPLMLSSTKAAMNDNSKNPEEIKAMILNFHNTKGNVDSKEKLRQGLKKAVRQVTIMNILKSPTRNELDPSKLTPRGSSPKDPKNPSQPITADITSSCVGMATTPNFPTIPVEHNINSEKPAVVSSAYLNLPRRASRGKLDRSVIKIIINKEDAAKSERELLKIKEDPSIVKGSSANTPEKKQIPVFSFNKINMLPSGELPKSNRGGSCTHLPIATIRKASINQPQILQSLSRLPHTGNSSASESPVHNQLKVTAPDQKANLIVEEVSDKGHDIWGKGSSSSSSVFDHEPDQFLHSYPTRVSYVAFTGDNNLLARVDTSSGNLLAIYHGDMEEGLPHGTGTLKFSDKDLYEGAWANGLAHGKGVLKAADFEYKGTFSEGLFDGSGTLKLKGQGVYEGQFAEGRFNGKGKFTWEDGKKVYVGSWKSGLMHGRGLMVWSDGRKFYGDYYKGLKHGKGMCVYSSGAPLRGVWQNGVLNQKLPS